MSKPLVVFIADVHMQEDNASSYVSYEDAAFSLEQAVTWAKDHEVECFYGAGDLTNKPTMRGGTVVRWYEQLDRLYDADIDFVYIQGQHDMNEPNMLSGHAASTHGHRRLLVVDDLRIYGFDYTPKERIQEELDLIPKEADTLVMHQVLGDYMGEFAAPQLSLNEVPGHIKRVVFGDLHKSFLDLATNKAGKRMQVASPGSAILCRISEPDQKFFVVLYADGTFKRIPLKTRPVLHSPKLKNQTQLDTYLLTLPGSIEAARIAAAGSGLPERMYTPIVHVQYGRTCDDAPTRVAESVGGDARLVWTELAEDQDEVVGGRGRKKASKGEPASLLGCLSECVTAEEKELNDLCRRVLDPWADEPVGVLERWWHDTSPQEAV